MVKTSEEIRKDFPLLERQVHNKPLVYLDNAATTQKPQIVIDTLANYYRCSNSNIHRGVHAISQEATAAFEHARQTVQRFLHAETSQEIIFTRGTTESINLVASSFGRTFFTEGSQVLVSAMEHHSNIVPWQIAAQQTGAEIIPIPMDERGVLDMDAFEKLLNPKVKIIALAHVSNTLGTVNPIKTMIASAHRHHIPVLIDGAQAAPHLPVDVQETDADFYCFSGHKLYAPMGVGVLYGKRKLLEAMPPYQGGGEMISEVRFEKTTYNELPYKFEAGTPSVGDVVALEAAIHYMESVGWDTILKLEDELMDYCCEQLQTLPDIRFIGQAPHRTGVVSFLLGQLHPFDVGTLVDQMGIALRTGHHCAQPVMDFFRIAGTLRASFAVYTTKEDIDKMVVALKKAQMMLQ